MERIAQGVFVQGTEALVDEHGVHADGSALSLHHVGKAKSQGKAGQEGFAAGEGADVPPLAGGAVQYVQVQAALVHAIPGFFFTAQGEQAVSQHRQALVGGGYHLFEIILLYVGFKGHFCPTITASDPGAAVVQIPDDGPVFFSAFLLPAGFFDLFEGVLVDRQLLGDGLFCVLGMTLLFVQFTALLLQSGNVRFFFSEQFIF